MGNAREARRKKKKKKKRNVSTYSPNAIGKNVDRHEAQKKNTAGLFLYQREYEQFCFARGLEAGRILYRWSFLF